MKTGTQRNSAHAKKSASIKKSAKKCEHGRQKRQCKDCGGSAICEHNKRKTRCKECGGSELVRGGGSGFCEHGRQKRFCKECKGSAFNDDDVKLFMKTYF